MGEEITSEPGALDFERDPDSLPSRLRGAISADRRVLADPEVKRWCGRRWRGLLLANAEADPAALDAAAKRLGIPGTDLSIKRGGDERSERRRLAERFLHPDHHDEADEELPAAPPVSIGDAALVVCPGLIGTMLPLRAFQLALPRLASEHGVRVLCADAHPMRSCSANVADLVAAIERGEGLDHDCKPIDPANAEPPGEVILIGYSKGTADALTLLVERPDLAERVTALYCWGGAVGGSYLADDIYERVKDLAMPGGGAGEALRALIKAVFPIVNLDGVRERLDEFDIPGAIRDLTTSERGRFLAEHAEAIDALDVPIFNVTASTTAMEVPFFQVQGYLEIARRDPDNDMQLTRDQARMTTPMATDLAGLRAHHWDISYDPFPIHTRLGSPNLDHRFPRYAALEAIVQLTGELGLAG